MNPINSENNQYELFPIDNGKDLIMHFLREVRTMDLERAVRLLDLREENSAYVSTQLENLDRFEEESRDSDIVISHNGLTYKQISENSGIVTNSRGISTSVRLLPLNKLDKILEAQAELFENTSSKSDIYNRPGIHVIKRSEKERGYFDSSPLFP